MAQAGFVFGGSDIHTLSPFLSFNMLHQLVGGWWEIGSKFGMLIASAYSNNLVIVEKARTDANNTACGSQQFLFFF